MTAPDFSDLRELLARAAPGPLRTNIGGVGIDLLHGEKPCYCTVVEPIRISFHSGHPKNKNPDYRHPDAKLIVALRNRAESLLDELERLMARCTEHEEDCACLLEDMSVTETVNALQSSVEHYRKLSEDYQQGAQAEADHGDAAREELAQARALIERACEHIENTPNAAINLPVALWSIGYDMRQFLGAREQQP